ncbi:MAG: 30S ribosomal protein S12 methylthiotransferase RimO [Candidatus Omnitrophica bacterium]|nr:30S ribosomal protein S12 methylthiotransferase RimO [Candidatus Omnitrophota bacterium]
MKIAFISLGCPKNLVDTEKLIAIVGENGFVITDSIDSADFVIINTCGFIKEAVVESEETIEEVVKKNKKVIICGCLAQREKEKLLKFKNIKGIIGVGNLEDVIKIIKDRKEGILKIKNCFKNLEEFPRVITTFPYAYIKISDGCINFCSYCLIPKLRGPLRSRKLKDILREAENIEKMGYKEIILIAQDTTNYGIDLKDNRTDLIKLLKELEKFDFEWIRIMYMHPGHLKDELIEKIAESKKICKYFDIPFQHVSFKILEKMNRPVFDYRKLVEKIRNKIPNCAIRTNFIVGFPGETEEDFKELLNFIEDMKIDRVGFFKYSNEKGTLAFKFKDQINERIKEERLKILIKKQEEISKENLEKYVGKKLKILIEKKENGYFTGRTEFDAPEIDGVVYIKRENLKLGNFYYFKITSSDIHDLYVS